MPNNVRVSAKALVLKNGHLLALRMRDEEGEFCILPGGGVGDSEILPDAVCREVAEETGLTVDCRELLFVIEGLHGEPFHRIDMVFRCEWIGRAERTERIADQNQIGYTWLDVSQLNRLPLYPSKLRRAIMSFCEGKPYDAYLGNENMGDPPCED